MFVLLKFSPKLALTVKLVVFIKGGYFEMPVLNLNLESSLTSKSKACKGNKNRRHLKIFNAILKIDEKF